MSNPNDPVAAVLRELLDRVQTVIPQQLRLEFQEEGARLGADYVERFTGEPIPVPLIWQGYLIEFYNLAARWLLSPPVESAAFISAYEAALVGLIDLVVDVGEKVAVDGEDLRVLLDGRHMHWRAEVIKKHRAWVQQQNAARASQHVRPTPGEVIAAFLARHQITEKELLGRTGKFSKNTLAKIKRGEHGVRPDRYTALAVAMAELEPDFERDSLLPL